LGTISHLYGIYLSQGAISVASRGFSRGLLQLWVQLRSVLRLLLRASSLGPWSRSAAPQAMNLGNDKSGAERGPILYNLWVWYSVASVTAQCLNIVIDGSIMPIKAYAYICKTCGLARGRPVAGVVVCRNEIHYTKNHLSSLKLFRPTHLKDHGPNGTYEIDCALLYGILVALCV
jgi:hypothetical protein